MLKYPTYILWIPIECDLEQKVYFDLVSLESIELYCCFKIYLSISKFIGTWYLKYNNH